ncbi:nucleotidyltransferase [Geminocystis sp. NIES-3708]|uniref:nucleotidyltransferase family protein n=1 Tax=Geminocystis sp. NIES-3708 TaxID=1615909 RepID=UPI0005FCB6A7|nr:nucleotidyltransferase family protein [Geminocystis sp. NIES-3708]BAQ59726.1 nucleotidyltransferase [Geminocystis sp. NIES-3708]
MNNVTEDKLTILKKQIRVIKSEIQEEYQIEELGLFGSYIRGEETENSDIDILIKFKSDARFGLVTYCELENLLSEKLGKKVDLVMKDYLKPHLSQYILNEVVYL